MEGLGVDGLIVEELKRSLKLGAGEIEDEDSNSRTIRCKCAKCVADDPYVDDSRTTEILHAVTGELLGSLRSTVNYFNNSQPQDPVRQIILTGGGSLLSGFAGALSEVTHLRVIEADPFSTVCLPRKGNAKKIGLDGSIAVALGLALRSTR